MTDSENARFWFGVQLEVTQKLLAAEDRRLAAVQDQVGDDAVGLRRLGNLRLRKQFEQLNKEYDEAVAGFAATLKSSKHMRSLPSVGGIKAQKSRSSLFSSFDLQKPDKDEPSVLAAGPVGRALSSPSSDRMSPGLVHAHPDLIYEDSRLVSGTLDALIDVFLPTDTNMPDKLFIFTFLATSRLFIAPHMLLAKMADHIQALVTDKAPDGTTEAEVEGSVAHRCARLLREWTETFSYDFRNEKMMLPFKEITKVCARYHPSVKAVCAEVQRTLFQRLNSLEQFEGRLKREIELQIKARTDTLSSGKRRADACVLDFELSPADLAKQLKIVEMERLQAIGPEEFIQTFVRSDSAEEFAGLREARNVEAYVEWINRLGSLVATELLRCDKLKERIRMFEYFMEVAHQCYLQHNFNSVMGVMSALNYASIARLRKTWNKISAKQLQLYTELEAVMNPTGNFRRYREEMLSLMQAQDVVPFFSLMIKDVYFTQEMQSIKTEEGHINFQTMWTLSDRLADFMVLKSSNFKEERNTDVIRYLKTVPVLSEYELYRLSVRYEPPARDDKDRTLTRLRKLEASTNGEVLAPPSRHASLDSSKAVQSPSKDSTGRSQSMSASLDAKSAANSIRSRIRDSMLVDETITEGEEVFGFET